MEHGMNIKAKSTIMLIVLVTIWGATFPFEKMVLADISPFSLNFYRFLAADMLLLFMFFPTIKRDLRFVWKEGMILGTLMSAGYILQTWGLSYTSPAKSGFITALYIVLIPFFSFFIEKSRLSFTVILGLFTATFGIYLRNDRERVQSKRGRFFNDRLRGGFRFSCGNDNRYNEKTQEQTHSPYLFSNGIHDTR